MIYKIFFSDGNDRDELGRVNAPDIDKAVEYALKQYFAPDIEYTEEGEEDHLYLMLDSCKFCDKEEIAETNDIDIEDISEICENCEISEYIEIVEDKDADPEYKTIYGVNEYADLSTPDIRPTPYNPTLVKAWSIDSQTGVTELMFQTINDNPKLCNSVDIEYLKQINKNHEKVLKK